MKFHLIGVLIAWTFFSTTVGATEYIHRELMANTLSPLGCETSAKAVANASKPSTLTKYSKRFCQSQGYGWHVEAVKQQGKLVCEDCAGVNNDKQKCHLEDVVVSCQRIKPGSVGMLPGKS